MATLVRTRLGGVRALPARLFSSSAPARDVLSPHEPEEGAGALPPSGASAEASAAAAAHASKAELEAKWGAGVQWGRGQLADMHTPIYPMHDVPRRPGFPGMPDAPVHKHINYPVPFLQPVEKDVRKPETVGEDQNSKQMDVLTAVMGMRKGEIRRLHQYTAHHMPATVQTKKGKIRSHAVWQVVGSPERGLVGIARGRGTEMVTALTNAYRRAVMSMEPVDRFEQRTVWGQGADLVCKWRSTTVIIRARPPGFGLQVPHIIHRILTACGVRDASATIEGSRNPINVMHCTLQILHGGFNPPGFGSGTGGKGRHQDKGAGMRSIKDFERQRGRFGVVVDKRL